MTCPCNADGREHLTMAELRPFGSGCTGTSVVAGHITGGGYVCPELARLRRVAGKREESRERVAAMLAAKTAKVKS